MWQNSYKSFETGTRYICDFSDGKL